jgi:bifunctional DNA-binding transcriptional regulator/antitoxin component of YhaV-PrlF toxin-antitoxin module
VTDQLIAPVIPPAAGPARGRAAQAGGGRPLPLAGPLAGPGGTVYGMCRIDASGRLTSQAISHVLDWRPGDRLTLTADAGVVVARRDPHGMVIVPARCAVAIPAPLRHRCGLRSGDRVLLAALPREDTLAACTFMVVDQALRTHPLFPRRAGGRS